MDEQTTTTTGGLTPEEEAIMAALVRAWDGYCALPNVTIDGPDFRQAIHTCQRILATRIVARDYPDYWQS